ncbi:MAG TPA: DinB family protein [Mucilaginibacter sp.]
MINRPQPDEYPAYAAGYVNLVGNGPILEILQYQQQSTYDFFITMDPGKAGYAYAPGKWTVKEVLGHIVDTERVFAYRALVFSREAIELPGFNQDVYVAKATFNSRSLVDIANEFKAVREASIYLCRGFSDGQQTQKGIANGNPVSVRALAYLIAGHEMHHVKILKEKYL